MSYDFYAVTGPGDSDWVDPHFSDAHPAFSSDGAAGKVMLTEQGYARCGNYTSNVSGMWTKCLTAAIAAVPDLMHLKGADGRRMRERGVTMSTGRKDDNGNWIVDPYPIDETKMRLRDLAGARMGDIAPLLARAVEWGVEHIEELREDNPPNGWGNAEGAVTYLWDIQRMCEQHPDATLGISS